MKKEQVNTIPILALAYIGDAIYEVYVREYLIKEGNTNVHTLHKKARQFVSAIAQSSFVCKLEPLFNDQEMQVYKRGRNANARTSPKNTDIVDYRRATGLEAVIGYLHLSGQTDRLDEIMSSILC